MKTNNHPANGPLTIDRLTNVRDVLQRKLKYSNGGSFDYIIADAVKAIDELLAGRKAEPVAWRYRTTDINGNPNPRWSFSEEASLMGLYQPLYTAPPAPVDNTFIPKNLDRALGVVGVALPESKEEFNFQIERWIQRLIDRVIRYSDEFKEQPAPVVPPEQNWEELCRQHPDMSIGDAIIRAAWWNLCRAAMLQGDKS
ncbi:hypothetical protein [Citrobacter sp. CK204]|uniref:hypothetical protein n=1 Tax=Citrobacter sp. CK204 TaxID=2985113 RepID=UPI0025782615|nr:hypothetical protein [Citrobacter sp. CK204]MDM3127286.1 hypothetical protein [Citrobacter sp. CK204]